MRLAAAYVTCTRHRHASRPGLLDSILDGARASPWNERLRVVPPEVSKFRNHALTYVL